MKISVVTVCYNAEKLIEETILSVINQTYSDIEYIIIDGASTDDTMNIVNKYRDRIAIIVSEPDKGIFDAMNKSLAYINGQYVIFMNAGDKFYDKHIVSKAFDNIDKDYDLVYGDVVWQTAHGYMYKKASPVYLINNVSKKDLIYKSQGISHQALFTNSCILKKIKFDLKYPIGADYDTTAKIFFLESKAMYYVSAPISIYDDRNGGFSHDQIIQCYKERFDMFNYKPSLWDWLKVYVLDYKTQLVRFLEKHCPSVMVKYRQRKQSYMLSKSL
jgi:glycosyltransferase involved in cell wall biosynthesis